MGGFLFGLIVAFFVALAAGWITLPWGK